MVNKNECYAEALQQVRNRHHRAIEKAEQLREQLFANHPDLREIENKLIALMAKKSIASAYGPSGLDELNNEIDRLTKERETTLKQLDLAPNVFQPKFVCSVCDDYGLIDGKYCDCVKKTAHQMMLDQLCQELPSQSFSFDSFSIDFYNEGEDQEQMKHILQFCKDYAAGFHRKSESLYMLGNTGLGKTHLTFSLAKEVVSAGYSVIYSSAQNMISTLEKVHFGQIETSLGESYTNCDLLVLDDLGTEFLSQIAQTSLYNVINQRMLLNLPTIINSNLTPKELEARYGDRLVSRIFGYYRTLKFVGKDIRIQKRLSSKKVLKF